MLHQLHEKDKNEYAKVMRILFSPPSMLNDDGSINQKYFVPKKVLIEQSLLTWTDQEEEALEKGIKKYGVGDWTNIIQEFLPNWDSPELILRTCKKYNWKSVKEHTGYGKEIIEEKKKKKRKKELEDDDDSIE